MSSRKTPFKIVGILLICFAVYIYSRGIFTYVNQVKAEDWVKSTAVVTNTDIYVSNGLPKHHSKTTRYNISYQYTVNNSVYTGEIINSSDLKYEGRPIDIKYNPEMPEQSTYILEPNEDVLFSAFVFGSIWAVLGLLLTETLQNLLKR